MFYINFLASKLEICRYAPEDLEEDCAEYGINSLSTPDWQVFTNEEAAEIFLERYLATLRGLSNSRICKSRDLPAMLLKRRYIVQTLMGVKSCTYRGYRKKWESGQLFNFYDQTFFLTVRLSNIEEVEMEGDRAFRYTFTLPT